MLGVLLATGCTPEMDFVLESFQAPTAQVSGTAQSPSLLFTSEAGRAAVVFTANQRWTASLVNDRASGWCSLSETKGKGGTITVYVSVEANPDYDQRSASIQFTCDDITRTLVVTQKQKDALFLESNRIEMTSEGGTFTMTYRTNVESKVTVAADAADWIIPLKSKGLSTQSETFNVKANETLEPRQGSVEVTSALGKEVLTVYQAGEVPTLVLGAHEVELSPAGEAFSVQVTSNLNVSVTIQDGRWLHEVATKTLSTNTYYFMADRNESREDRMDLIVFRDNERGVADSVHVRQAFQPILADTSALAVPGNAAVRLELLTAGSQPDVFKVSPSESWLVVSGIEPGDEGCRILLDTRVNEREEPRECVVRVYCEGYDLPDEVKVSQAGKSMYFTYSTKRSEVVAPTFAQDVDGFILWGDGSYDRIDPSVMRAKDLVHIYSDGAKTHSILVESAMIPWLLVSEPEDGMHFDFSTLKKKE